MPSSKIRVIKLSNNTPVDLHKQKFSSMPQLYLELIENKDKIDPKFVNADYIPTIGDNDTDTSSDDTPIHVIKETPSGYESDNEPSIPPPDRSPNRNNRSPDGNVRSPGYDRSPDGNDRSPGYDKSPDGNTEWIDELKQSTHKYDESVDLGNIEKEEDQLSDRLKELLRDDGSASSTKSMHDHNHRVKNSPRKDIPTLADLENDGKLNRDKHIPNVNNAPTMSADDDEDRKRELLFKFELLKKSYAGADVPEYNIHTDYKTMYHSYQNTLRRLSLDSKVENYKTYLIAGFMMTEFLLGRFLKLDMQGFTNQQLINMHSYDKLLIELGEKKYVPEGSEWSVELRLLFLVVINAAIFIVSKLIMKKTGSNIMNMMNNLNGQTTGATTRKRKMKGPDINLDDLPDSA